ncbi:hypothetical protein SAMN05216428_102337 [Nitrosospira sp. Nsp11]|uniref:helix-turn-helix domain-containing protein n=1 Tax=Nitrosospira sp. Nsp11 TaxID=1855338 RepID=UPI00091E791A|nr:helix-turn-helix transcriptional regulator [Nitrosospira sp. Nsp11]SHL41715.1 hypothetical protein SAMN05216428_102337 [Nitrosospira sp. Nsp11]
MKTLAERLKFALDKSGKKKTDIWKGCGLSSGAISHWFNNPETEIKGKNLLCAARILGVRPEWLSKGTGDHALSESEKLMNQISEAMYSLQEDDLKHVSDLCVFLMKKSGITPTENSADTDETQPIKSKQNKNRNPKDKAPARRKGEIDYDGPSDYQHVSDMENQRRRKNDL